MPAPAQERRLVLLVGAVQFVNVLEFMIVMPMGPDFAATLDIPTASLGLVGGAYTGAAALSGLVGALFLDRFDRRTALGITLVGLMLGTAAGGFATGFGSMIAARVLAGIFGGPASALGLAILTDTIPLERRGKALGAVMSAFSIASIVGVPLALELAHHGGWRLPFFAVAGLGAALAGTAVFLLPPLRLHLDAAGRAPPPRPLTAFLRDPAVLCGLAAMGTATLAGFALIPNISAYFQFNRGYPRDDLGLLYLVGGLVSFVTVRGTGRAVDRVGPMPTVLAGTVLLAVVVALGFVHPVTWLPPLAVFVGFMFASALRNVAINAMTTRVPLAPERARYMSSQSAVQHISAAAGAVLSTFLLVERPDHSLAGIDRVGLLTVALVLTLPLFVVGVTRALARRAP